MAKRGFNIDFCDFPRVCCGQTLCTEKNCHVNISKKLSDCFSVTVFFSLLDNTQTTKVKKKEVKCLIIQEEDQWALPTPGTAIA